MEAQDVTVDSAHSFWSGSSGRWAGERLIKAMEEGRELSASELRTAGVLRKDEWIHFDEAAVEEGVIRLRGVADLMAAGLTRRIANGLGKTVFQYEKVTDMQPANVSLDGMAKAPADRQEFDLHGLPLPIIHKDFFLNLRTLTASRSRGEGLDTMQARTSGRLVSERVEHMLFNGYGSNFGGLPIYGYTTHPQRNVVGFGSNGNWSQAAKTGENMLDDVLSMMALAEADHYYGPYVLYIPTGYALQIAQDFKTNSDKSIRNRLLEIDRLTNIVTADQMPADTLVLVQLTPDVVMMIEGEPLQTVQWDIEGGFQINFKVFTIMIPLIRSDAQGRSGVVHMS